MNVRDKNVLKHILEYCEKLISYTEAVNFQAFECDSLRKDACALSIMAQLTMKLSGIRSKMTFLH